LAQIKGISKIKTISSNKMCHKEGTESQYEVEKVVCNDIENDPHNGNWKEEALSRGYQSLIALL
jgi:hypothetical protein